MRIPFRRKRDSVASLEPSTINNGVVGSTLRNPLINITQTSLRRQDTVTINPPPPNGLSRPVSVISQSPVESWTEQIRKIHSLSDGRPSVQDLRVQTDLYLIRDQNKSEEEWSAQIASLIRTHPTKRCAFLACIHILSTTDARALLLELKDNHYLELVIEASNSNQKAVSENERQYAETIKHLEQGSDKKHIDRLKRIEVTLSEEISHELQLTDTAKGYANQVCQEFCEYLSYIRQKQEWSKCELDHAACTWLRELDSDSPVREYLDKIDPKWVAWAYWRPDRERLKKWRKLDASCKPVMKSVVALEGPDFNSLNRNTLKHSFANSVNFANSPLAEHLGDDFDDVMKITECLLTLLDTVLLLDATELSTLELFYSKRPMETKLLTALSVVCESNDTSSVIPLLRLFTNKGNNTQLSSVLQLAPRLSGKSCTALRELLSESIIKTVEEGVDQLKIRLCKEIDSKKVIDMTVKNIYQNARKIRECKWLYRSLSKETRDYMESLPSEHSRDNLISLRKQCQGRASTTTEMSILAPHVDAYLKSKLGKGSEISNDDSSVMFALIELIQESKRQPTRDLALRIGLNKEIPASLKLNCLQNLHIMRETMILAVTDALGNDLGKSSVQLVKHMADPEFRLSKGHECWDKVLHWMLVTEQQRPGACINSTRDWINFITDLQRIAQRWQGQLAYTIDHNVLSWTDSLSDHIEELGVLERRLVTGTGMQWIFNNPNQSITTVLPLLSSRQPKSMQCLTEALLGSLTEDGANLSSFIDKLVILQTVTEKCQNKCNRILNVYHKLSSKTLAEALLLAWHAHQDFSTNDRTFMMILASTLKVYICVENSDRLLLTSRAQKWIDAELNLMLEQFENLESIHHKLNVQNSRRTRKLVSSLGIHIPRGLSSGRVPSTLVDVIEEISDHEFELFFPLIDLKPLQRKGMNIGDSRGIAVRLIFDGKRLVQFCLHLQGGSHDHKSLKATHKYSIIGNTGKEDDFVFPNKIRKIVKGESNLANLYPLVFKQLSAKEIDNKDPSADQSGSGVRILKKVMTGNANSRASSVRNQRYNSATGTYYDADEPLYGGLLHEPKQVAAPKRQVPLYPYLTCPDHASRLLLSLNQRIHDGFATTEVDLARAYSSIKTWIDNFAQLCIICGTRLRGSGLFRATTCSVTCSDQWKQVSAEIRLSELVDDPQVLDMLLVTINAAAQIYQSTAYATPKLSTLPPCPFKENVLVQLIPQLPDLYSYPLSITGQPGSLIAWALREYGGFITKATGIFHIPLMNGVHQFVLAHSNHETHAAFTRKGTPGTVMFHGTTLDRVYSILCTGLQSLSNTAYEKNGRAGGHGIYLAEEPTLSLGYSTASVSWPKSGFKNSVRVLLGCEAVGATNVTSLGRQPNEICTVSRPSDVAVRYIFIFESWAKTPLRKDIVPAMEIAYAALRSGVA